MTKSKKQLAKELQEKAMQFAKKTAEEALVDFGQRRTLTIQPNYLLLLMAKCYSAGSIDATLRMIEEEKERIEEEKRR